MNKRETVKEIARCAGTLHVANAAREALRGEASLDRALNEAANHSGQLYVKRIANEAIDK